MLTRIGGLVLLLALNAFFVAAEFAMVRARRTRLETLARNGDLLARMAVRALGDLPRMLSVTQVAITLCGLGLGWVAEEALVGALGDWVAALPFAGEVAVRTTIATIIALTLVTFFTVVFGELTPKTAALNHPEAWARIVAPVILFLEMLLRPFTWLLNRTATLTVRALGQTPMEGEESVHSAEELRMLVEQSQESGALQQQDAEMLDAVFEFSEKNAREVMTPRTEIIALDVNATLDEVMETIRENRRSRYPVYNETIDDIVGVLLVKDLIPRLANPSEPFSLSPIMRPPHFVPGSREVEDVLADFKRRKEHMAIVLDEYGGTDGIVTMEDLLEEIVGEILDEYDVDDPDDATNNELPGVIHVAGATNVNELNEEYGTTLSDEHASTVGGYVFGVLGRLPMVGDRVTAGGATFTVTEMEGRRVATLSMELVPGEHAEDPSVTAMQE